MREERDEGRGSGGTRKRKNKEEEVQRIGRTKKRRDDKEEGQRREGTKKRRNKEEKGEVGKTELNERVASCLCKSERRVASTVDYLRP